MKQKRKHILKKLLIFGIAVLLTSCSEELFDEAIESSNKRAIKEVRFNELYKDSKFKNLLEKVSHTSNAARTSFENQNGFTISDGFVKVIETDSVISYTMLIERDVVTDTISFENLVIQENKFSASEKAYSIKYTPTTIAPSGHNSFYYEGTEVQKNLAFTGFNRVGENAIETNNCYVNVVQVWCSQPNPGETKHHIAGANCSPSTQYYKVVNILSSDCEGSSSSSSGSSGSNNNNAPQEPTGPGNNGGITSPVNPNQGFGGNNIINTPCQTLTTATNTAEYKAKFNELNQPDMFTAPQESGFALVPNTTGGYYNQDLIPIGTTSLKPPNNGINFTHVHNNQPTLYPNGITIDTGVKILSPADIQVLTDDMLNNNTANGTFAPSDTFAVMISNEGIFAVVPTVDYIFVLKEDYDNFDYEYYLRSLEILVNKRDIYNTAEKRKKALEKMLLQLIDETPGLKGKLQLFEGNASDPTKIKWTKKSLNSSNPNNVDQTPC
jgi:hypothetical protein